MGDQVGAGLDLEDQGGYVRSGGGVGQRGVSRIVQRPERVVAHSSGGSREVGVHRVGALRQRGLGGHASGRGDDLLAKRWRGQRNEDQQRKQRMLQAARAATKQGVGDQRQGGSPQEAGAVRARGSGGGGRAGGRWGGGGGGGAGLAAHDGSHGVVKPGLERLSIQRGSVVVDAGAAGAGARGFGHGAEPGVAEVDLVKHGLRLRVGLQRVLHSGASAAGVVSRGATAPAETPAAAAAQRNAHHKRSMGLVNLLSSLWRQGGVEPREVGRPEIRDDEASVRAVEADANLNCLAPKIGLAVQGGLGVDGLHAGAQGEVQRVADVRLGDQEAGGGAGVGELPLVGARVVVGDQVGAGLDEQLKGGEVRGDGGVRQRGLAGAVQVAKLVGAGGGAGIDQGLRTRGEERGVIK